MNEDATTVAAQLRKDPGLEREWLRQSNLIYGGLIGVAVVLVQPFLSASSLDVAGTIAVVAFAVAIPLLAALVLLNEQEAYRRRATRSRVVGITKVVAQSVAMLGVLAAFWHINPIAGVATLVGGIVGALVHSAGYWDLEKERA